MKKKFNNKGEEKIMGVVILCVTFIVFTTLILQYCEPITGDTRKGSYKLFEGDEIIGGVTYAFWIPNYGHNVTDDNISYSVSQLPEHEFPDEKYLYFFNDSMADTNKVRVTVVRDNVEWIPELSELDAPLYNIKYGTTHYYTQLYRDFIYIIQYDPYAGYQDNAIAFSYEQIILYKVDNMNYSVMNFMLHTDDFFTMFITTPNEDSDTFDDYIWANNFNIKIGISENPTYEVGQVSFWKTMGQILTLKLPYLESPVDKIVATPFWLALGFCAVVLISRFIPFIRGL